ncbi:MAG: hypothetical protein LBT54_04790 [Bifidobacteriaceae bacterium]|jgi:hypothetical protein|nr:hypothetical protein [Bifidobacteriaceae bacterium]
MTGIDDQLEEPVRRVWEIFESRGGGNPSLGGRPSKLDLFDRAAVTLALLRQNMT